MPETVTQALDLVERAENEKSDFIEIRLDRLGKSVQLADLTDWSKVPLIAANRSVICHGNFKGGETERTQVLLNAARHGGFEFIDIEFDTSRLKEVVANLKDMGVKPIISSHDFNKTPTVPALNDILRKEIDESAEVCKIVTTAKHIEDNLTTLNFVSKASRNTKVVCFSMGELGRASRLLSPLFGGFFTIASLESGRETASGQMTIEEMRTAYEVLGLV